MRTTPMKHPFKTILLLVVLVWIVVFLVGRIRWPIPLDQGWSQPIAVTGTQSADMGGGDLYKWHDTLMLVQDRYDYASKSATCSIMVRNSDPRNSWTELPVSGAPGDCAFYCPTFDQGNNRIMFARGSITSNQWQIGTVFLRMAASDRIQIETERSWSRDQASFISETGPTVHLNTGFMGKGILDDGNVYLPYSVALKTLEGNSESWGPYNSGVFYSTDLGKSWQIEKIADWDAAEPEMCRTKDYCYYFGMTGGGVWFSRKLVDGASWSEPNFLTKTYANQRGGGAVAEGDTVYFCWLDRRHEKWRLNIEDSHVGNYEVAFSKRNDADSSWHKDVILSKGLSFSYWPAMSAEGNKIVIAWESGESNGPGQCFDIYYATSKDGGQTWTRPLKVTDKAKDGITSERPQVALQNGVINLFYGQGKWNPHAQVQNQGGWPVYYQQRPFPE
jgi:hypothetical protein